MPYHPQTNELEERSHQMILHMIVKLGEDKKTDWPSHLAEISHAYNSTWSTVTGYSLHYLMSGWWPRVPVNFVFPTNGSNEAPMREALARSVDLYVTSVRDRLRECPVGGTGPIHLRSTLTETVLWQKNRHSEFETWWPSTSEGRYLEGKEED